MTTKRTKHTEARDFSEARRIVVKVGTNVLSKKGAVDVDYLRVIAKQISHLVKEQNRQVILVTSGALGMGAGALGMKGRPGDVKKQQACAAIGQVILMHEYREAFGEYGQEVAQVLLTNAIMSNRKYYVNLKNSVETLLGMNVVPIVNENDCVSIDEIGLAFGDNDKLSALIASKIDAELLIVMTDVDGLYNKNPKKHKDAEKLSLVFEVNEEIESMAGTAGSAFSTGGMKSKIDAIKIASHGGCRTVLAHGRETDGILRIVDGDDVGTLFLPHRRLSNRKRWILNCRTDCMIEVDDGAEKAVLDDYSLLAVGIRGIHGRFGPGDVVQINGVAKGIADYSSRDIEEYLRTGEINGSKPRGAIVHSSNIVAIF